MNLQFSIQRSTHLRRDSTQLQQLRDSARVLILIADKIATHEQQPLWLRFADLPEAAFARSLFLGCFPEPVFALQMDALERQHQLEDLRSFAALASDSDMAHVFFASAIFTWQQKHQFCGVCGGRNQFLAGGHEARCEQCRNLQFPRTDPAVIVAVTHGDKILLGRQQGWPEKRFSVLAGFVEPGESLEQACAREILEESGVRLKNVNYFASQPWPFPSSLMLAFFAEAESTDIQLHDHELEQALWLSPDELEHAVLTGQLVIPPSASVARRLLRHWFDVLHQRDLQALLRRVNSVPKG
jgi:NAD+ diphosphatase